MITTQKIVDKVNDLLYSANPTCFFYIQTPPQDFKRPAIYIEITSQSSDDNNFSYVDEEITLQIVYFGIRDNAHISSKSNLVTTLDTIKNVFKGGHIVVDDRTVKVVSISGAPQDNEIYISVSFSYTEDRPITAPTYIPATEIKINLKEG